MARCEPREESIISPVISSLRFVGIVSGCVLGSVICLVSASAHAADAPPFPELLRQALVSAPELVEQRATVEAAGADALQARAWLNPRVDALSENIGAPASGGVSQRQETYSITQPFEIGGKRGARIEAGARNLAAAEARGRQSRVAFAAELALAYATVEASQSRRTVASEEIARADDDLRAAKALVEAGKEADLRLAQARASVASARAGEQAASADLAQALENLSAMSGAAESFSGVAGSLMTRAATEAQQAAAIDEEQMPSVMTARAERDALSAQLEVERKRWIPDVGVSVGQRQYAWTSSRGYALGISASIPLFDDNRHAADAAAQRVAAADARLAAARLQGLATRRSSIAQLRAAERRLAAAGESERTAGEAYRLSRIGYDAGKTSLLEVLAIRRALSDARTLIIDARLAQVRALTALAQADGRLAFGD